jgi:hypothetical protein
LAAAAAVGLGTGFLLSKITAKEPRENNFIPMALFTAIQGGLVFALAHFLFRISWLPALAFPAGALVGFAAWMMLGAGFRPLLAALLGAALIAGGLAIGLRLEGVPGGVLFGLALLNGAGLGGATLPEEKRNEWYRWMAFGAFLVAGRAAIQYYLWTSGYAELGVVVTHPYTFLALFAGLFLPLLYPALEGEELFPNTVLLVLAGVVAPLALGVFIHVRPMAAYLFGIVASVFAAGILLKSPFRVAVLGYLSLAAGCAGLPLFRQLSNLSRTVRLEILGGIFLLSVIFYLIRAQKNPRRSET